MKFIETIIAVFRNRESDPTPIKIEREQEPRSVADILGADELSLSERHGFDPYEHRPRS